MDCLIDKVESEAGHQLVHPFGDFVIAEIPDGAFVGVMQLSVVFELSGLDRLSDLAVGIPERHSLIDKTVHFLHGEGQAVTSVLHYMRLDFHILHSVEQQDGCCEVSKDHYEITQYSDCMDTDTGILYYTTYNNHRINGVNMHNYDLSGDTIITVPIEDTEDILIR